MRLFGSLSLSVAGLGFALSSCSYAPHDTRAAYESVTDATQTHRPMAQLPPEAGAVVATLQSRVSGVLTQRIVLSGDAAIDGENAIIVKVDQNERRPADVGGPVAKPTAEAIGRELESNFPDIDMPMTRALEHNAFGAFGYAFGRAPQGVGCLYAWQFQPAPPPLLLEDPAVRAARASMPEAPTSVRVRLCRQGLGESELVALMRAMQVFPPGEGAAYLDTRLANAEPSAADALQAAGAPAPAQAEAPRKHPRAKPRHAAKPNRPVADAKPVSRFAPAPMPGGATVGSAAPNPLLAPLQGQAQGQAPARSASAADDMPLPGDPPPPAAAPAAKPLKPSLAPIPLPN